MAVGELAIKNKYKQHNHSSYLCFCQALLHSKALDSFHYYPTFPFMLELFSRMHDIHIKLIANTEHVYSISINQTFFCV